MQQWRKKNENVTSYFKNVIGRVRRGSTDNSAAEAGVLCLCIHRNRSHRRDIAGSQLGMFLQIIHPTGAMNERLSSLTARSRRSTTRSFWSKSCRLTCRSRAWMNICTSDTAFSFRASVKSMYRSTFSVAYTRQQWFQPSVGRLTDSTNVLCPLFDETEILILGDNRSISSSLDKMINSNSLPVSKQSKNDFIEAVHQTGVYAQRRYVHSTLPRRF